VRLTTALADRYRIERELGQGGMATVYLAADPKHGRQVAIKVLKPELAAVLGAERFLQEIRTTAQLQHPHILPLFDSGKADTFLYYVMPFVEGETLRDKLQREKQLGVDDALATVRAVAGALDFAHKRGVIHRDIKPENILLQDGVPLVADFGIAVAVTTAGGDRLTQTGLSLGTPAYMSPEQAVGERELDARSDVYALGCLTYELLAGDPPFVASSAAAVIARHVTDVAPPITTVRRNLSSGIAAAVAKALNKAPADRPSTAGAFAALLDAKGVAGSQEPVTLVVLPFVNRSQETDNEFFSDGLTEEIIADLSRIRALRVISRNSAMTLKGTAKDTPTIARELGVTHLVTGSVRRAGNALRVTVELVSARTDEPVWSEKYSGTLEDVFGIQEEIARKIVAALKMTLTESESREVAERPIENPVAYDCYLKARQEMYSWRPEASRRGLRLVDEALRIVGDTPLLLAMKGQLFWNEVNMSAASADEGLPPAEEAANRALAIDPDYALAIFVRGLVAGARGQPERALPDLYRAHLLWPGDANILAELCRYSITSGAPRGDLLERLAKVDPLMGVTHLTAMASAWSLGRFDEVAAPARRACELAPPDSMLPMMVSMPLAAAGFPGEVAELLEGPARGMRETSLGDAAGLLQCAVRGDREGALRFATARLEEMVQNEFTALFNADAFMLIGRREDALRWVRRAIDRGFINYPVLSQYDPFLADLRSDPRFVQMMDEVKPRWEWMVRWGEARS
jgi:serine/threonine-protein kinase